MMRWFTVLLLAFALTLPVAVAAGSFGSLIYTQEDPEAIVMTEESEGMRGGEMRFIEIDPVGLTILKRKFGVSKEMLTGRLKTKIEDLQMDDENPIWTGYSRFSGTKKPAGVYALDEVKWDGGSNRKCPNFATPVFRFKPGVANLVPVSAIPIEGSAAAQPLADLILHHGEVPKFRRNGEGDSLLDAQAVLDERAGIKAKVEYAEVLGYVAWKGADGELSGCNHKGEMVWVTPEMFKTLGPGRW